MNLFLVPPAHGLRSASDGRFSLPEAGGRPVGYSASGVRGGWACMAELLTAVHVIIKQSQIHQAGYAATFIAHKPSQHTLAGELLDGSPTVFHRA